MNEQISKRNAMSSTLTKSNGCSIKNSGKRNKSRFYGLTTINTPIFQYYTECDFDYDYSNGQTEAYYRGYIF